ncbi:MAG: hypothetical protein IPK76_08240 [Lewinellaceae bacterium]|nr:hypothetical protein [Lewinellaceae bacterium]
MKPGRCCQKSTEKQQRDQAVVDAKFGEWRAQGCQKRKPVGDEQVSGKVPDHNKSAESGSCDQKTPEIDFAAVFRGQDQVVHTKKPPHRSGHEQCQKYQKSDQ